MSTNTKDNEVRLNASVLSGPDIWLDPRLDHQMFVSDRLAKTLRETKLPGRTKLIRCTVVTLH